MIHRIEVHPRPDTVDAHGQSVLGDIRDFGITSIREVRSARLFLIESDLSDDDVGRIGDELLADPVTERSRIADAPEDAPETVHVEVHFKPGVMDPVAESTMLAIRQMGLRADGVRTARAYRLVGQPGERELDLVTRRVLSNDCIEHVVVGTLGAAAPPRSGDYELNVRHVPIRDSGDQALMELSQRGDLFLDLDEMRAIRSYYRGVRRDPTDVELETLAQTWSEHCVHKTLRSEVELTVHKADGKTETRRYENLLRDTIARATTELDKDWCVSVFEDNAGIIDFDGINGVCFKVETHNHPSAIEPYGGAATGIGGVIRDIVGTGLAARPIANTDIFCFARPDLDLGDLPTGVLHPRRVMKGVVAGVRDYGNRMGIPTVNGAICFDDRYLGNPLVYCGCVGLIPNRFAFKAAKPGDLVVVVGGRTGRDGIHGATFSSGVMTHTHEEEFSHAVQIGNAITEKKFLDVLLEARDYPTGCLYTSITDCGAGGLSSAVGEMGEKIGAEVDLETVPLKYEGLRYDEIWISEAQERMVLAVPEGNIDKLRGLFEAEDVEMTVIGRFRDDRQLILRYQGTEVGRFDMEFLHEGLPRGRRMAVWREPVGRATKTPDKSGAIYGTGGDDFNDALIGVLSHLDVASKEWVIRQYDHEVQGGSVVKPLVGPGQGPSDAAVVRPVLGDNRGVALACGICTRLGDIDPHYMAVAAIDEAVRNVVAVGGDIEQTALLDNFGWGDCTDPEEMGALVLAAQGCYDAAIAYGTPFISGKDSLNNEFKTDDGRVIRIPRTLLISAISVVEDVTRCITMDLKQPGNTLILLGPIPNELAGSVRAQLTGDDATALPPLDLPGSARTIKALGQAIHAGRFLACHDISDGGLAVALAEMCFAGDLGAWIDLAPVLAQADPESALFAEGLTRFVVEVAPDQADALGGTVIGRVDDNPRLQITANTGPKLIDQPIAALKEAWQAPLAW